MLDKIVKGINKPTMEVGDRFKTLSCGYVTVLEYKDSRHVTVKFDDGTILASLQSGNVIRGSIKNPNYPTVYNVGYFGVGKYSQKEHRTSYDTWLRMLRRCYDDKTHSRQHTYEECEVAKSWHNFQNFAQWYERQIGYDKGWQLDKDIMYRDNIRYSKKTCCLVPHHINTLFTKCDAARGKLPIGVSYVKVRKSDPYKAMCQIEGKQVTLGHYTTVKEAFKAYKKAKEKEIKRYEVQIDD